MEDEGKKNALETLLNEVKDWKRDGLRAKKKGKLGEETPVTEAVSEVTDESEESGHEDAEEDGDMLATILSKLLGK